MTFRVGSRVIVVVDGTCLWKGTVGIVAADDSAGVTLRVGSATATVPQRAVLSVRAARALGIGGPS